MQCIFAQDQLFKMKKVSPSQSLSATDMMSKSSKVTSFECGLIIVMLSLKLCVSLGVAWLNSVTDDF